MNGLEQRVTDLEQKMLSLGVAFTAWGVAKSKPGPCDNLAYLRNVCKAFGGASPFAMAAEPEPSDPGVRPDVRSADTMTPGDPPHPDGAGGITELSHAPPEA